MMPRIVRGAPAAPVAWLLLLVLAAPAMANEPESEADGPDRVVYVPPDLGAPPTRMLAAVPGEDTQPIVQVLAPERTGLTLEAQPTLYWFAEGPTAAPLEVTMIEEGQSEPLLEVELGPVQEPGFHALHLADAGVALEPGVDYRWSVALVPDGAQRSADLVSSATIRRALPEQELSRGMEQANPMQKLEVLARHGYWYDLMSLLSAGIETHPENIELRRIRADLLEQVGLEAAAAEDRRAIGAQ